MIRQVTFMDGFDDVPEYRCGILIPDNISGEEESKIVLNTYNRIRRIMGLEEHNVI